MNDRKLLALGLDCATPQLVFDACQLTLSTGQLQDPGGVSDDRVVHLHLLQFCEVALHEIRVSIGVERLTDDLLGKIHRNLAHLGASLG